MNLEKLRQLVNEVCDEYDHKNEKQNFDGEHKASGGKMARTDLITIAKDAQELVNMFGDEAELPDWVESKLTKAADYLNSVKRYVGGEIVRQQGGLMEGDTIEETGFYRRDPSDFDAGVSKYELGAGGEDHERGRKKARDQKKLERDFLTAIQRLKLGKVTPRKVKSLINKFEKAGLKNIPDFDLSESVEESAYHRYGADKIYKIAEKTAVAMMNMDEFPHITDRGVKEIFLEDAIHIIRKLLNTYSKMFQTGLNEEREVYLHLEDATYDDGEMVEEDFEFWDDVVSEAEYRGRKVSLNKPMRGDVKKFKVFVKDPKTGNVKKVNFGDPNMRIKKSNPKRRKSFRARHNCDNPGPKTKARYWSCRKW